MRVGSRTTIAGIAAVLLAAACTSKPVQEKPLAAVAPQSTPVPAPPPGPKAAIGDFGLDLAAGKPQVKPGDDFFGYASGTWYENFEIPPDRSSFGVFNQLDELSKDRVRDIIESAAASQPTPASPAQKIGDYYAAFMDQAAIESNGLAPVQDDLKRISAANSKQDIATLFARRGSPHCLIWTCRRI